MSNSNGYNTLTKSMNGIITLSDGSGTVIEDDTITTDTLNVSTLNVGDLNAQNVVAPNPTSLSSLYVVNTGAVQLGTASSNVQIGKYYLYDNSIQYINTTTGINLLTNTTQAISIGSSSSPLIGQYTCTTSTHLANKGYVDSAVSGGSGGLLASNNTWTGTNKFTSPANLQSLTIDESSTAISQITSRTNTADNTMITNRIRMSSGTSVDNGRMQFYGGIVEWFSFNIRFSNNTATNSMVIDNSTANQVEQFFCTNNASPTTVTASILVSGGTTTPNSGTMTISGRTLNIALDMDVNSGTIASFQNGSDVRFYASCDVYRYVNTGSFLLYSGDTTIRTNTTTVNLSPSTWLNDATYIVPFSRTTAVNFNLSIVASEMRDGSWINIVNQSSANCPIATSTDTRMFGEEPTARCTRGGQAFIVCGSNRAVRIRCMENLSGYLSNTAYTFGYFCSVIG